MDGFARLVTAAGVALAYFGLLVEVVAVVAMGSADLRQKLRFVSPFTIQAYGCLCFVAGAVTLGIGRSLEQ